MNHMQKKKINYWQPYNLSYSLPTHIFLRSDTHSYPGNLEQTVHPQVLGLERRKETMTHCT